MNTTDIMKNPAFTPILFEIESRILACVRAAKADGIEMNDSQLRSILNKVRKTAEGGKPQIPDTTPRDKALAGLHGELCKVRTGLVMEDGSGNHEPLPIKIWILCIRTVEESIQRHATGPQSRGYQDFIAKFVGTRV